MNSANCGLYEYALDKYDTFSPAELQEFERIELYAQYDQALLAILIGSVTDGLALDPAEYQYSISKELLHYLQEMLGNTTLDVCKIPSLRCFTSSVFILLQLTIHSSTISV
ncbi:hypothetical protein OGAPHI_002874 [Ogataea philodendri]|uniref:Uncharacterized protein n=1 Tax=Ogataea philodendri TaxID=1378263 RepID=A0A9P8P908_9ASCO|nr:uncharacterized protein OGAPHI_002874 [Ogataea philodendri]KAH3667225.1 hypothetical protein OGAPHI_002874 [Ogataea philodendri]